MKNQHCLEKLRTAYSSRHVFYVIKMLFSTKPCYTIILLQCDSHSLQQIHVCLHISHVSFTAPRDFDKKWTAHHIFFTR